MCKPILFLFGVVPMVTYAAATLCSIPRVWASHAIPAQEPGPLPSELQVTISPLKEIITSGDTLKVRVEIWNIGRENLFICRDFRLGPCDLRLSFEPPAREARTAHAADRGFPGETETFANALVRDWISMPPEHFYGAVLELDPASYPELKEPGRYRIRGRYVSGGLLAPAYYNRLLAFRNEVAQLPAKSWQGEVDTNSITVLVAKRIRRP